MSEYREDPLAGFRDAAHRRRNRLLLLLPVSVVVGGVLGAVTFAPLADHFHQQHKNVPWSFKALFVLGMLLFVGIEWAVIALVHRRRHGTWLPEPARLAGADRKTRKRVARLFRRGQLSDDPTERALAVDLAQKVMRLRHFPIPSAALAVLNFALIWFQPKPLLRIAFGTMAVGLAVLAALYGFLVYRGKQILRRAT
jgi:hypothetical protein